MSQNASNHSDARRAPIPLLVKENGKSECKMTPSKLPFQKLLNSICG